MMNVSLGAMAISNFNPFLDDPWVMEIQKTVKGMNKIGSALRLETKAEWVRREPFKATTTHRNQS